MIQERMFKNKHEGKDAIKEICCTVRIDVRFSSCQYLIFVKTIISNSIFMIVSLYNFLVLFSPMNFNRMSELNIREQIMFAEFLERHGRDRSKVNDVVTS